MTCYYVASLYSTLEPRVVGAFFSAPLATLRKWQASKQSRAQLDELITTKKVKFPVNARPGGPGKCGNI